MIADDDLILGVREWADAMNRQGHASMFARPPGEANKKIVDRGIVQDFAKSLKLAFGIVISDIENRPPDEPDCMAMFDGRSISIELTELVRGKLRHNIASARKAGCEISTNSELFNEAQWNSTDLASEVRSLLDIKNKKREKTEPADILLIHSDEPWLYPSIITECLSHTGEQNVRPVIDQPGAGIAFTLRHPTPLQGAGRMARAAAKQRSNNLHNGYQTTFSPCPQIRSAYLMITHVPAHGCLLFKLYGNVFSAAQG